MDDARGPSEGHSLQGPHREVMEEVPAGFRPLYLCLESVGVRLEVHRADVIVGRDSHAEVRLGFPDVSRRHCRLVFDHEGWRVVDLSSLNGVFVNGDRVHEATLYDGDRLHVGPYIFVVEHAVPPAEKQVLRSIADVMQEKKLAS
jgi:pSer/pThr/pTyr-binding forkhead associated (FHA) protein